MTQTLLINGVAQTPLFRGCGSVGPRSTYWVQRTLNFHFRDDSARCAAVTFLNSTPLLRGKKNHLNSTRRSSSDINYVWIWRPASRIMYDFLGLFWKYIDSLSGYFLFSLNRSQPCVVSPKNLRQRNKVEAQGAESQNPEQIITYESTKERSILCFD